MKFTGISMQKPEKAEREKSDLEVVEEILAKRKKYGLDKPVLSDEERERQINLLVCEELNIDPNGIFDKETTKRAMSEQKKFETDVTAEVAFQLGL